MDADADQVLVDLKTTVDELDQLRYTGRGSRPGLRGRGRGGEGGRKGDGGMEVEGDEEEEEESNENEDDTMMKKEKEKDEREKMKMMVQGLLTDLRRLEDVCMHA